MAFPFFPISIYGLLQVSDNFNRKKSIYFILIFISSFFMVFLISTTTATPRYTFLLFPTFYILFIFGLQNLIYRCYALIQKNGDLLIYSLIIINLILSITLSTNDSFFRDLFGLWQKH